MSEAVQNLFILLLVVAVSLITYSVQIKKTKTFKLEFSVAEVRCYKGLFSVFIVLDHLWMARNMISLSLFHEAAVILVTVFFFFSGYGVCVSAMKSPDYLTGRFWKKRLTSVLFPMVIADLVMVLVQYIQGRKVGLEMVVPYLTGKGLLNGPTWYIRELLVCYLFFYVLFRKCIKPKAVMIGCGICITLMNVVLLICGYGYAWYGSSYGFLIGICFGFFGGGTKPWKENRILPWIMAGSFVLTAVLSIVYKVIGRESIVNMLLIRNVMTSSATILFVCFASILEIRARKFDVISAVSMEIYLLHMPVIELSIGAGMGKYPFLLVFVVVAVTIMISNFYHKGLQLLKK